MNPTDLESRREGLRQTPPALAGTQQAWFELFDMALVGCCTLSSAGDILVSNLAAADLLGQARAELVQRRFAQFLLLEDQPVFQRMLDQRLTSGEAASCELRLTAGDAAPRAVRLTAGECQDEQGQRAFRLVMVDVSARRQAEAALQLAEQAKRQSMALIMRVSHELHTPLNAILGFSRLMLSEVGHSLPSDASRPLSLIADSGEHLRQLVADLLELSRIGGGHLALRITQVDLGHLLQDCLRAVGAEARAAAVDLAFDPGWAPSAVLADPTRLRQVLLNLLSNAVKYNRRGGWVSVHVSRHGNACRVHVVDNGLGMSAEQQAGLFQPFNRLGREAEGYEGTGLGLVIARDLVLAMGGQLGVSSVPGVGSAFVVDLPAAELPMRITPADSFDPLPRAGRTRGRVLCVEDDVPSQALLRATLALRPALELDMAETGAAAIAAARRHWPDLLILGQRLPDMSGLDVLKVLRLLKPHLSLRCLVVSADVSVEDIAQVRDAGADAHLAKPSEPARLLAQIDVLLGAG